MDATTRWETEALRTAPVARTGPPRPSRARARDRSPGDVEWVTLKEAERVTGIPANTLRKWVRRSGLASYLESDGELQVRMVDLGAVRERARALGRHLTPPPPEPAGEPDTGTAGRAPSPDAEDEPAVSPAGTMIVPVDAWNKMLTQLGNLHEAGQQLAEARERAAKAETEAAFLRERLAELRSGTPSEPRTPDNGGPAADTTGDVPTLPPAASRDHGPDPDVDSKAPDSERTTTYWRYLTAGWRRRSGRGTAN